MDFNILECKRFIAPTAREIIKRTVRDYEIDYYITGKREMFINGEKFDINAGDICFRRPGQEVYSFGDYNCYLLTLDFSFTVPRENYNRNSAAHMQPEFKDALISDIPAVVSVANTSRVKNLFSTLEACLDNEPLAATLVKELLFYINADVCHSSYEQNKQELAPIDCVARYISRNFRNNITLELLAKEAFLNRSYLVRAFKAKYGVPPIKYLIDVRLAHAEELLLNTAMPIYEIAEECGYKTGSFFISQYKRKYGMSPAQHRAYIWQSNQKG